MFAYGLFFDRFGEEVIDFVITESQTKKLFNGIDGVVGPSIAAFVTESAIRGGFKHWGDLANKASRGKPIILDDDEWLIALAGTREAARKAYLKEYAKGFA